MPPDIHVTSAVYWWSALVEALIDVPFVAILAWRVGRESFSRLKWPLALAAMGFWTGLWSWAMASEFVWTTCYQYVWPVWARWAAPPTFGLVNTGLALAFWWLALRAPGRPPLALAVLGGLHSFPGHLWAIYARNLLGACPLLEDVNAASALTFGAFEFVFYWCVVLTIALALRPVFSPRLSIRGAAARGG